MSRYCRVIWPQWQRVAHNVSGLISVKWSMRWCLPPNHMPVFVIESRSSTVVSVILMFDVLVLGLATMVSIAADYSSHLGVQTSFMLLDSISISACSRSMSPACLPYHFMLRLYTRRRCFFWSLHTSMMAKSIILVVIRMTYFIAGSIMLLVAATISSPIRLPI